MKITNKLTTIVALSVATLLNTSQAVSLLSLEFDDAGAGGSGTVGYETVGGVLSGEGIGFGTLSGSSTTPLGSTTPFGPLTLEDTEFKFATGDLDNYDSGDREWTWQNGGSFSINGTVKDSSGAILVDNDTLISGFFTGSPSMNGNSFQAFGTADVISNSLIAAILGAGYGADTGQFTTTEITMEGFTVNPDGTFGPVSIDSSDATITTIAMQISSSPIPSGGVTFTMLGFGLVCLGFARKSFATFNLYK